MLYYCYPNANLSACEHERRGIFKHCHFHRECLNSLPERANRHLKDIMQIHVYYGERSYGQGDQNEPYIIKAEVRQDIHPIRKDAVFPAMCDVVSLRYYFNPEFHRTPGGNLVPGGVFEFGSLFMSVEEAEELVQLLLDCIHRARVTKAPVKCEFKRNNKEPAPKS
jgi:hypothetical protein